MEASVVKEGSARAPVEVSVVKEGFARAPVEVSIVEVGFARAPVEASGHHFILCAAKFPFGAQPFVALSTGISSTNS